MKWLVFVLLLFSLVYADDFEDDLSAFDNEPEAIIEVKQIKEQANQLTGTLSFASSYNYSHNAPISGQTDYRGISRLKTKLELALESKLSDKWKSKIEAYAFYDAIYSLKDTTFTNDTIDTYEKEFEIKEAYILGSLTENIDLKVGRQIVVWGKSDNIRLNDLINPLDNRELGMVDIEDLRLPIFMSKLDYYSGVWNLSAMIIHENRIQREAAIGSDYLPIQLFIKPNTIFPEDEKPSSSLKNTQYALALNGRFTGWDFSFYSSRILDHKWHFSKNATTRVYSPVKTLGFASNIAIKSWLLTSELVYINGLKFNTTKDEKNRLDFLLGAEYKGITDFTVSLELAQKHIYNYELAMLKAPDSIYQDERQTALRMSYVFDHEKGTLSYLNTLFLNNSNINGGFQRLWLNYDLNDDIEINFGLVDYIAGDKITINALSDNDRLFADISYHF